MYKINEVSNITGLTTRTIRYYDEIDLLKPSFINESGYRIYTSHELNILQQILLFKELDVPLLEIKNLMRGSIDSINILKTQRQKLEKKIDRLYKIIESIDLTILEIKGEIKMSEREKFAALKEKEIAYNENKYGKEIRENYGDKVIDESYTKVRKMSKWEYEEANRISALINDKLSLAIRTNNPQGQEAMEVCSLHQKWIKMYWPNYDEESHLALVKMYTKDVRFKAYYEKIADGATDFLYEAMQQYLK